MRIISDMPQGSDAWHEFRAKRFTASEAPAMLGVSKYMTRDELLSLKSTGETKEVSAAQQALFDRGHAAEAAARSIAEGIIGEELFPVTVADDDDVLSASMDGLTMLGDTGWECKLWSEKLAEQVRSGELEDHYKVQMDQQMLVSGAERILFMCTDGTHDNCALLWYARDESRFDAIIAGWNQFRLDLENYTPTEASVKHVGVRPDSLPTLFVDVGGSLTTKSNLDAFRAGAESLIGSIKTDLVTDEDFSNAEAAIKWLDETEKNIDLVIQQSLSKTGPLDELIRTLKDVQQNLARTTRLNLTKQVDSQKKARRNTIVTDAKSAFDIFLKGLNAELAVVSITSINPDFAAAIKGKRSFDAMVSACNDLIAASKIEANEVAAKVRKNLALLESHKAHDFLFPNKQQLAFMESDHLNLTIKNKIAEYKQQQEADEQARIQKHKNTIAGIEAAGAFGDDVPLDALVNTRRRLEAIVTTDMAEFALTAMQAKDVVFAKLDARISELRDQAAKAREATAPEPVVQPAPAAPVAAVKSPSPTGHVVAAQQSHKTRPTDEEIIEVLALHFRVHEFKVIEWLVTMDLDRESRKLASNL